MLRSASVMRIAVARGRVPGGQRACAMTAWTQMVAVTNPDPNAAAHVTAVVIDAPDATASGIATDASVIADTASPIVVRSWCAKMRPARISANAIGTTTASRAIGVISTNATAPSAALTVANAANQRTASSCRSRRAHGPR